jgi:hypothetical protein
MIISLLPKLDLLNNSQNEYFPIFNFDLYSLMPNSFERYDLIFNKGTEREYFLFYDNKNNSVIQKKYYRVWLIKTGKSYESGKVINTRIVNDIIKEENSVDFVKISGRYSTFIRDGNYELKILKKIK